MKFWCGLLTLLVLLSACGRAESAILIREPSGALISSKLTLDQCRVSPQCAGKEILITTPLSAVQSNISSATVHQWPADRPLRFTGKGSLGNTTVFRFSGSQTGWPMAKIFAGTGRIEGLSEAFADWWGVDGVSDQVEVNQAIQSLVTGGVLRGSTATYITSAKILVDKTIKVLLPFNVKIMDNAPLRDAPDQASATFSVIEVTAPNVMIDGITVDGNRSGNPTWLWDHSANYGVSFHAPYCTLQNSEIKNVTANCAGPAILGGTDTKGDYCSFINNKLHGAGKKGIHSGKVVGALIQGNTIYGNEHDSGIGLHQGATQYIVTGNNIYGNYYGINPGESFDIPGLVGSGIISHNSIHDNIITNVFVTMVWDMPARPTGTITAITKANPAVVTSAAHGLTTGTPVQIITSDRFGMTEIYTTIANVTVIDADRFSLDGVDSTTYSTFSYGSWIYEPTQEDWDTTGLSEDTIENRVIISENDIFYTAQPTEPSGGVQAKNPFNIEVWNTKGAKVINNNIKNGGLLDYNGIANEISNNTWVSNYAYTQDYLIALRSSAVTGSHRNRRAVVSDEIKNNRIEVSNVVQVIDTSGDSGTAISGNTFRINAGGTYEVRVRDAASVATVQLNQPLGRIRLGSVAYPSGYTGKPPYYATAMPTAGLWTLGTRVENNSGTIGAPQGWRVTTAGGAYSVTRANSTPYSEYVEARWSSGSTVWTCTTAGVSNGSEPDITGKVVGNTVTDGTVVWTMNSLTSAVFTSEGNL